MTILHPERAVVPIVRSVDGHPIRSVLGTGFLLQAGESIRLVTAKHVFEDNPLQTGERYAFAFRGSKGIAVLAILRVIGAVDLDLAVCDVPIEHLHEAEPLPLASDEVPLNHDIWSFEYSSTRIERTAQRLHVAFEPYAHKGNIVRAYLSTFPETVPTQCLLTSFPALQGASGAPIIVSTDNPKQFAVAGITVANVERHLIPAQILTLHGGGSEREEVRYFLPYGKAIATSAIAHALTTMGVPFDAARQTEPAALDERDA